MKAIISAALATILTFSSLIPAVAQIVSESQKASADGIENAGVVSDGRGNLVRWQMPDEPDTLGFLVYRLGEKSRTQIGGLIAGPAMKPGGAQSDEIYSILDPQGRSDSEYVIEAVSRQGRIIASEGATALDTTSFYGDSGTIAALRNKEQNSTPLLTDSTLNLTKGLMTERGGTNSLVDINMQRWVAGQPGVRIGVKKEGVYRVTRASLQSNGFDVNSDPVNWRLFAEGEEQDIIVGGNGDYIEFYGRGIDIPESDLRAYYLVAGNTPGKRMATKPATRMTSTVATRNYSQTFTFKERVNYMYDILNGETENYFGRFIWTLAGTPPINFQLSGVDYSLPTATVTIKFHGYGVQAHSVTSTLNGHTLGTANVNGQFPGQGVYTVPTSYLVEGNNSLQLVSGHSGEYSFFDSISISFDRKFVAQQDQLSFYTLNYRSATLQNFSSANVRLYDVTREGAPVHITNVPTQPNGATFDAIVPANRGRVYFAVENSAIQAPAYIVQNFPSTLAASTNAAQLVIIAKRDWLTEAEAWADYRRGQGFTAKVVDIDDVMDEFGYGVKTAEALRSFLLHAKATWQTPPQYVLLLGDASYDPRNYENGAFLNIIPTKYVTTIFTETPSDDYLVDANLDGIGDMAIGRISVRNALGVSQALAKVQTFETPANQSLARGSIFVYDVFDVGNNYDFQAISIRIRDKLLQSAPPTPPLPAPVMVGLGDAGARDTLRNAMNTGKYIVNFSGHGTAGAWANGTVFANSEVPNLTNANNRTIFTMLTCLNGYFVMLDGTSFIRYSLAENLVQAQNGGGIAVFASSGLTVPSYQEALATRFYEQVGLGTIQRMGDLVIDAKTAVVGGTDVRNSYVLIGDPMLKIH